MSGYNFDEDTEDFRDIPDEVNGQDADPVRGTVSNVPSRQRMAVRQTASVVEQQVEQGFSEQLEETQEEQDEALEIATVLSDARLRLEQGRLYETIMNQDLFQGIEESDERAIKHVQKEIRKFAKERMEIMLGMRQEEQRPTALSLESFPFNALEIEVLRALADTATQGASREAEPFDAPMVAKPRPTLKPISVSRKSPTKAQAPSKTSAHPKAQATPLAKAPAAPVKRAKPNLNAEQQRILQEEGVTMDEINEVFDPNVKPLSEKEFASLTAEQLVERNRQTRARTTTQVRPPNMSPYPTLDAINQMSERRASEAGNNAQMQLIMTLLNNKKSNQ
jgi:uncharacterized protein YcgL (UPF0745 family)